jgi:ornithine carbamoyltransferase
MRHIVSIGDLTRDEIQRVFAISDDLKSKFKQGLREPILPGRVVALVFEKPSLRTRASFEAGVVHMGGCCIALCDEAGLGKRETTADFARVLSQYVDAIVARTKSHQTVVELAANSDSSVINGLTDLEHPCQALADLFTLRERLGSLSGKTLAFVGDANNVARSLAIGCGRLGMELRVAAPAGYQFTGADVAAMKKAEPKLQLTLTSDPAEVVRGADAVYTDVWASMGQEAEHSKRCRDFAPYQVNAALMAEAGADALFMHCLPAHRGEEVTDEVIDSAQSVVVEQAANRMHVQKGVLAWLLGAQP